MLSENQIHIRSSYIRHNIDRILCPTDLSPGSDAALRYAVALAKAYNAKLYICHAIEEPADWNDEIKGLNHIKTYFDETLLPFSEDSGSSEKSTPSFEWEGIIVTGEVAKSIAQEAAERHIDLIVMRSRRRPHAAAILGSTAEELCRIAPCPVLITHPDQKEWISYTSNKINLKRVLIAYDFSDYSELALSYGLTFAQEYQAQLHLLHVLPQNRDPLNKLYDDRVHKMIRRLQYAIPEEAHYWCQIKEELREGTPYREILSYAEENEIDMIFLGAHGTDFNRWALFGSNVDRVLRQAKCPVLVGRPLKPANKSTITSLNRK